MSYQPLLLGLGTAVVRTTANTNVLEGETANIRIGQPVVFRTEGTSSVIFGGVVANTVYYIKEIIDSNQFKISATLNGADLELTNGQGFMLVRSVQKEAASESLRKVDEMLEEIYSGGIGGGSIGGTVDGGSADSSFNDSTDGSGGISSIIEDEAPALGGNLNLNDNNILGAGNINISGSINATVFSGGFRGVLAGSLTGPVDDQGARTGNPTIDGLPFELGNPQAGQVIAWDAPNEKFRLVSINAVSGSDTLDDVLLRGNTSNESIIIGSLTTDSLVLPNGLNYSVIVNPPTVPTDINQLTDVDGLLQITTVDYADITNTPVLFSGSYSDLTNTPVLFSGSYSDLTNKPTIPTDINQLADVDGLLQGSGGAGLGSRTETSATTGALAINSVGNINITGFKTYALLAMAVEIPAWVRVYASADARTADAARLETEDPQPGSGVIAEVITTTNEQLVLFTPATIGFNAEIPAVNTVYLAVKNKGSGVATIEVTLVLVQLEA